ncbi:hypothetical protein Rhopal_007001-T1 [Rhodotorula paludigena]|uniref:non-specific serine/threonine protein kinase n=1 Tax=Rhodotorula paludigena TaxID=86838 RepID=A0AAV5GX79_9BASI|nr:hypothetical protein Rhopal_007001-T1 [Rhodotorula paludigena]
MATPSAAFPYSPTPQSPPSFPSAASSSSPSASADASVAAPAPERRSSQKRASAAVAPPQARYPSPPLATTAPAPSSGRAALVAQPQAYDPSLVIPPFNPHKRRSAGTAAASGEASSSSSSRRTSATAAQAYPSPPVAQYAPSPQIPQAQQQQRPVSVMPGYPGAASSSSSQAYHHQQQQQAYAAQYAALAQQQQQQQQQAGGSVSSRVRQSVGYLPSPTPSSSAGGSASSSSFAGQGPYPHLYTPHPMPKQKVYFGPYILLQTLGEGEFGKVKLGVHGERWGEDVAIKLIKRGNVDTVQRGEKVRREIEVLKLVRHPNIVRLYDVIETEKYIGIVIEYASGGELFDHILAHRYLKERDASRLFAQLISGVAYLHAKGVVHRDLKLENLLLDRNRNVIITDFGFANRFRDADVDLMATSCGSPCYAAPELVVQDGKYVGTAVDVWSCGVILYAMLAGYLPYDDDPANPEGDNINLLYKYILNTPLTFPNWITDEPRDLLLMMLVPDPAQRCTIADVTRHPWLKRYESAFVKSVDELEYYAQEMERHKRQALEAQRQWLIQQQHQQQLAAQGLLAPSMTRSQTATSSMGQPQQLQQQAPLFRTGAPAAAQLAMSAGPSAASVQQQRHRSAMVTSASSAAVSAPLLQHGFEHYSMAAPSPVLPAVAPTAQGTTAQVPDAAPVSPRSRTGSTASRRSSTAASGAAAAASANPNRRSGAYTPASPSPSSPDLAYASAGPFSFAAASSVPMVPSLSAPAAPSGPRAGEDSVMRDRTPPLLAPSVLAAARAGALEQDARIEAEAQRRRRAQHRATVQVEYDGGAGAAQAAQVQAQVQTRRKGASKEPGLPTAVEGQAVEGLGIATAEVAEAHEEQQQQQQPARLEVPSPSQARGAPSPVPSLGAVSVTTTTETAPGEDVVMQSVDEEEEAKAPAAEEAAVRPSTPPPPAPPVPFPAAVSPTTATPAVAPEPALTGTPRKRKSSGSPVPSIQPEPVPALPPAPSEEEPGPPQPQKPKTSTSSQASAHQQPARPPSAASSASRHRHALSADRFSLRSLLGASTPPSDRAGRPAAPPASTLPPPPPVPQKDAPLDEVTNRRKSTRRQKALSLQPFRHSTRSKLPDGARANVESSLAASASRGRPTTATAQGEMLPPLPQQRQQQRVASSAGVPPSASSKRLSTDLEANWQPSSAGPTPSGKAKAVMEWFRRRSTRNDSASGSASSSVAHTPTLPPIQTEFDQRRPQQKQPEQATMEQPASSNTSMVDGTRTPVLPAQEAPAPAVVVSQPVAPQPSEQQQKQQASPHVDSASSSRAASNSHSQFSHRTASTMASSVSAAPTPAMQQVPAPAAFVASKLRFHQGALDKNAVTYRAPDDVIADLKVALWNMGVDMVMEGEYKLKCVRKSRKKALAASTSSSTGSHFAGSGPLERRSSGLGSPSLPQSPSMAFRGLFGRSKHGGSAPDSPDPLSSPMTASVSQFSMLSLGSPQPQPTYDDQHSSHDAGDEVRFVVELTRLRNLDSLYCVDVKRMKGGPFSFKAVYDRLISSLDLGPAV